MKPFGAMVLVCVLVSVVALPSQAAVFDANPAWVGELTTHQLSMSTRLKAGNVNWQLAYAEPDYGYGAGALGWERQIDEGEIHSTLFYTVATEISPSVWGGVRVRYLTRRMEDAGNSYEGQYFTSDMGFAFAPLPRLQLDISARDLIYYPLYDSPRDLGINLRPAVTIHLLDRVHVHAAVNDILRKLHDEQDWQIGAQFMVTDNLHLRADYTHGINYEGAQWSVGASVAQNSSEFIYELSGSAQSAASNLAHHVGWNWKF